MSKNGTAAQDETVVTPRLERVTVNLTPRSSRALDEAVTITGDSKTDTINRALQVYAYLERVQREGGKVFVQDADQDHLERLKFF
jgi:hypothetical protein